VRTEADTITEIQNIMREKPSQSRTIEPPPSTRRDATQPIRAPKTAEIVVDLIRGRIVRGELKEGDFLPPESQLMATHGISRPTLREAVRVLEAEGLISVTRGSRTGAQIHRPRVASVSRYAGFVLQAQGTTIADIYDARLAIEPLLARRLAEQRPEGAVNRLRAEADRLTVMTEEGRYIDFMIALTAFHRLLVELSGNRTLLLLTEVLQGVLARHQVEFFKLRVMPDEEQRRRSRWAIRSKESSRSWSVFSCRRSGSTTRRPIRVSRSAIRSWPAA